MRPRPCWESARRGPGVLHGGVYRGLSLTLGSVDPGNRSFPSRLDASVPFHLPDARSADESDHLDCGYQTPTRRLLYDTHYPRPESTQRKATVDRAGCQIGPSALTFDSWARHHKWCGHRRSTPFVRLAISVWRCPTVAAFPASAPSATAKARRQRRFDTKTAPQSGTARLPELR